MSPNQKLRANDAQAIRAVRRSLKGLQRIRIVLPAEGVVPVNSWENDWEDEERLEFEAETGESC